MAKKRKSVGGCLSSILSFLFMGYVIISILGAVIGGVFSIFGDDTDNVKLADGFTIEAYNIILDVKEDNKVFVE